MTPRRATQHGELQYIPTYYKPRRWVVRRRLKFLITRPRLREWADRNGLIVGVVNAIVVNALEDHRREISRALWFGDGYLRHGDARVFVDGEEIEGVVDVELNLSNNVVPISRPRPSTEGESAA